MEPAGACRVGHRPEDLHTSSTPQTSTWVLDAGSISAVRASRYFREAAAGNGESAALCGQSCKATILLLTAVKTLQETASRSLTLGCAMEG